jgi:hypothetical protein
MAAQLWATVNGTLHEAKAAPLWWQDACLSQTASGYGDKLTTRYMVLLDKRWRRIYCYQHSNIGTLFIGKSVAKGTIVTYIGTEAP